ncbi:oxidoreductase [Anderseniella sp. Alg231-50]|uniref:oxidoreductase n=1 Tax=Anderseniella sp. Alg231-50 TaxID=1922226 RepID=UPI000D5558BF
MGPHPKLFSPCTIKQVTLANRVVIAPMCQYSAQDGLFADWHFANYSKYALGRPGAIILEASAVQDIGRITHGDLGIWSDTHADAMRGIVDFIKGQGAVPGIQIGHAGRKACIQRPWHGNGALDETDAARGETAWQVIGPSPLPAGRGWLVPREMSGADIVQVTADFVAAAKRADHIGMDILELHAAHGYLLQQFLSPLSNRRDDDYGGSRENRMRFLLEVVEAVRPVWPDTKPLFVRISSVDGFEGGWSIEDSVVLAKTLKSAGVDVVDCSSGGNAAAGATASTGYRGPGFQVPYADEIRREADIPTMAVGLILDGPQAEDILQSGQADLIAIAREAINDPFWPRHQAQAMGVDLDFAGWPEQYGWWLDRRARGLHQLAKSEK